MNSINNPEVTHSTNVDTSVGYSEGYHFYFEIDGAQIHAHGSAKSGKEKVFVNEMLVAEKRSFGRKSNLKFSHGEHQYEVEFYMKVIRTGELHCSLIKNGVHVKTLKKSLKTHYQLGSKRLIVWSAIVGAILGFVMMKLFMHYFS